MIKKGTGKTGTKNAAVSRASLGNTITDYKKVLKELNGVGAEVKDTYTQVNHETNASAVTDKRLRSSELDEREGELKKKLYGRQYKIDPDIQAINNIEKVATEMGNSEPVNPVVLPQKPKRSMKDVYAVVDGFEIKADTIYVVTDKKDNSAPSGLVELGVGKMPFPDNHNRSTCPFNRRGNVYDTGFYLSSSSILNVREDLRMEELDRRREKILIPYQRIVDRALDQSDFEFWDNFSVKNYSGKVYDTGDIISRFELYISLLAKELTPKSEDGSPSYMNSFFFIENKTDAVDYRKRRALDRFDAISACGTALSSKGKSYDIMINILVYIGMINPVHSFDAEFVKATFAEWVEREKSNMDKFMDVLKLSREDELFIDILDIHKVLKYLFSSKKLTMTDEGVAYKHIYIPTKDLRTAASRICTSGEYRDALLLREDYQKMIDNAMISGEIREGRRW